MPPVNPSMQKVPSSRPLGWWIALLIVAAAATAAALLLLVRSRPPAREAIVQVLGREEAAALDINTSAIIEASQGERVQPREGWRYRVRIQGEARDGAERIARIGNMLTFVEGAALDAVAVVEVTRIGRTVAEAVVVLDSFSPGPAGEAEIAKTVQAAGVHTGVVEGVGRMGDGRLKVDGQTVYVPDARPGEKIVFTIIESRGRTAQGRFVRRIESSTMESGIKVGEEYDVEIVEEARDRPDRDGVARLGRQAVIVPDTRPGDRVRVRIVERRGRAVIAEVIAREAVDLP